MRVLVLSSCVATKKYDPEKEPLKSILEERSLPIPECDLENEERYRKALNQFVLPASIMYQGSFSFVRELVNTIRKKGDEVQFLIISARYGVMDENTLIIPYKCTFKGLGKKQIRERAKKLKIYEELIQRVNNQFYDTSIIILGQDYLMTIFDDLEGTNFFEKLRTRELVMFGSQKLEYEISSKKARLRVISVVGIGDRNKKIKKFTQSLVHKKLDFVS